MMIDEYHIVSTMEYKEEVAVLVEMGKWGIGEKREIECDLTGQMKLQL